MSRLFRFKKNEKGQTLVEFALILPILLLLVMGIIQFGILFSAQIALTNSAREGARAASVGHDRPYVNTRVNEAVGGHGTLTIGSIEVTYPTQIGQDVEVSVDGSVELIVPIPQVFISGKNIPLNANSSMRAEKLP